ncbi:MAG: DnaA ATPase domain-containing protein [Myxococcota bacterium]
MTGRAQPTGLPEGIHPIWNATLQTLGRGSGVERSRQVTEHMHPIRVTSATLTLATTTQWLQIWRSDGTLRALQRALAETSDQPRLLAIIPIIEDLRPASGLNAFLVSPCNQDACERLARLVPERGRSQTAIVLHGPSSSGKTHLLFALRCGFAAVSGEAHVRHLSAEEFSLQLVAAIRSHELVRFQQQLMEPEVLLIDDIDLLADRRASQHELTRALHARKARGALVVLSAQRAPTELAGLEPELHDTLLEAEAIQLHPPEWETSVAIVMDRIARWQVDAHPGVPSLIVSALGEELHGLDATLTRLMTHPLTTGRLHDLAAVTRVLGRGAPVCLPVQPEAVLTLVSRHFNLRLLDIRSRARSPRITAPRQIAMYLVRQYCHLSYPEIGRCFRRHHTTALHACRRIERERDENSNLDATLSLLEKELGKLGENAG